VYDLVGDFAAMQFFQINPTNGAVSVRRSLVKDRAYAPSYQVRVIDCSTSFNICEVTIESTLKLKQVVI